jgi:hypothetical protein
MARAGSGFFKRTQSLPDIGSIALSFRPWAARFPDVRFDQARGRQFGQVASKRPQVISPGTRIHDRKKRRQPFPCFMRPEDPEMKTKRNDTGANMARHAARGRLEGGIGAPKKKAVGVGVTS